MHLADTMTIEELVSLEPDELGLRLLPSNNAEHSSLLKLIWRRKRWPKSPDSSESISLSCSMRHRRFAGAVTMMLTMTAIVGMAKTTKI